MKGLISILIFLVTSWSVFAGNVRLKEPPSELSKYYPPKSESYEFVSLMHKLSVSFTGVITNVKEKDWEDAEKWAGTFKENYLKIGKMVKKWDKVLKKEAVENLASAVKEKNLSKFKENVNIVGKSCVQCHKSYKISTRILYRYPSFHKIKVEDPVEKSKIEFHDFMKKMTDDMKKLRIYLADGEDKKAVKSGVNFIKRVEALQQSCSDCHTDKLSEEIYYGKKVKEGIGMVKDGLRSLNKEKINNGLKRIGFYNCTKCHNTHIIQAEIQEKLKK
ncbi:cytochrome c [Persephonella sp.]